MPSFAIFVSVEFRCTGLHSILKYRYGAETLDVCTLFLFQFSPFNVAILRFQRWTVMWENVRKNQKVAVKNVGHTNLRGLAERLNSP